MNRSYNFKIINDYINTTCKRIHLIRKMVEDRKNNMKSHVVVFEKKELDRIASIARKRNVMIDLTENGKCIRIYPEFNSKEDMNLLEQY